MGTLPPFELEQKLDPLPDGSSITILAEVIIRCPGYHVCRSAIHRQLFATDIAFEWGKSTFSILDGKLNKNGRLPWITLTPGSNVIQHEGVDVSRFNQTIEACAGIGIVGTGLPFCGVKPACYVDSNEKFVEWLDRKNGPPVVHGDIGDSKVIKKVSELTREVPLPINGGIACQPFGGHLGSLA